MNDPQSKIGELELIADRWCEEDGFERTLLRYRIVEVIGRMRGDSLLDVGCGVGNLCRAVSDRMVRVVGVDGSPTRIEIARRATSADNVEYVVDLFEDYNTSETFDTVVLNNVLEHVDDPVALLKRVFDWLAPKGIAIVTVPNAFSLNKRIGLRMGIISSLYELTDGDRHKGHVRIYNRDTLTADIEAGGLRVTFSGGLFLKPLSNAQMETFADDKLLEALYEMGKEMPDYCGSLLLCAER